MLKRIIAITILVCAASGARYAAQEPPRVDFGRDVQPIFRQQCYGCHGPAMQQNGFRLDRRSDAMRGGSIAMIGPGNSEGSRMYLRLIGSDFGTQMPPTGALKPEQIAIIKAWIDQGAAWPDELANEAPRVAMEPRAARLMDAALWGSAADVVRLLDSGVDPNVRNEAGATPLMRAVDDLNTTRALLEYGADPNAKSDEGRTPLLMAAQRVGSAPVLKLLLAYGANPAVTALGLGGTTSPLIEAAYRGDAAAMRVLLDGGAKAKDCGTIGVVLSVVAHCPDCFDLLAPSLDAKTLGDAAVSLSPPDDDAAKIGPLLARGADVNAKDPAGRTMLIRAAASDAMPVDIVKLLIGRGADVNAATPAGDTALSLALLRGRTPIVDLLMKAGARTAPARPAPALPAPSAAASPAAAVARSLPLLQQNDVTFLKKSGCVSCHNNTLTAMAVSSARARGLPVDDEIARNQLHAIAAYMEGWRERALQGAGIPGDADTMSYMLLGLAAEHYPADDMTAAIARFLLRQQAPSGQWRIVAHRPPIESSDVEVTAVSMRALQLYAPASQRPAYDAAVRRAADWLGHASPRTVEDRAFQLLGLSWANADRAARSRAARALLAEQRPDGGWAPLPTLGSDAYSTGQAMVALTECGVVTRLDAAYTRGVRYLLGTQLADGSWFVRSRAIPIQPHFESGFPHGRNQFISAAATGWATMALATAVP
jgi:ankyrin repeat protein/mono/diheme cytochrome c family protein